MGSSADIQIPSVFFSNQDRALRNDLLMSKDPNGGLATPVPLEVVPTIPRFLDPVAVGPFISFGLKSGINT